jgi:hypothetical protein
METISCSETSVDNGLHDVISQEMVSFITTAVENLKSYNMQNVSVDLIFTTVTNNGPLKL